MNTRYLFLSTIISASMLTSCQHANNAISPPEKLSFKDVSHQVGLISEPAWKYGGPSVSDINNDGYYDFLLTNHDTTPIRLFMANGDDTYTRQADIFRKVDLHGIATGDYDLDGDNDVLIALGGGNGKSPRPQRLLRNDDGHFVDVTVESGLSEMGARGRSVRWIDLDGDGDLDFLQINAEKMVNEEAPRNIIFENKGNGNFVYRANSHFEDIDAERLLITDFNNDDIADIIAFNTYADITILQGNNDFTFTDMTGAMLPKESNGYRGVVSVAQADIDNDGDNDFYLARGKLLYTLANNSISFNEELGRLDLRDEGNKSHDGITLHAKGGIELTDFYHFPRAKRLNKMPVFIGADKTLIETPVSPTQISQQQALGFPKKVDKTGWYLGYLGQNNWRLEWLLADNLAWDIRASIKGLTSYTPDWTPKNQNVSDVLLRNDGNQFTDISYKLPAQSKFNNWGVTPGDFNNDSHTDFFIYRFGELKERIADVALINDGSGSFSSQVMVDATTEIGEDSHGDMGVAFDYNLDGKIDLLNGDDDNGGWYLYQNTTVDNNHYLLARIGYSKKGTDPLGARISIETESSKQFKIVGSSSATHSQSLLNITHFGLGKDKLVKKLNVKWRDGSEIELTNIKADQMQLLGQFL